eukprot:gene5774-6359_t
MSMSWMWWIIWFLACCSCRLIVSLDVPVYWLNLDERADRRESMSRHLSEIGVAYHRRVAALTAETCNLLLVDNFCSIGNKVIATLCSHVNLLYEAVHDSTPAARNSPFFLVLEDDVRFLYHVDFKRLISLLPRSFGSVQLMMSHKLDIEQAWDIYRSSVGNGSSPSPLLASHHLFTLRPRNVSTWSAQAILYRKDAIKQFLSVAVRADRLGKRAFVLSHSQDYARYPPNQLNPFRPTIGARCLYTDAFLYAMAQPSYVLNIPIFNSAKEGLNSSLHKDHVPYHVHGFAAIERITQEISEDIERYRRVGCGDCNGNSNSNSNGNGNVLLMPLFLSPLQISHKTASNGMNWTHLARQAEWKVSGRGISANFNF